MNPFDQLKGLRKLDVGKYLSSFVSANREDNRIDLTYYFNQETGQLYADVVFGLYAQGPPNHVHGGAISAVLDESMGLASWMNKYPVMTATLTTEFLKPVPLGMDIIVQAWIENSSEKKIIGKSKLMGTDGKVYAKAHGLFIVLEIDKFQKMGALPDEYISHISP